MFHAYRTPNRSNSIYGSGYVQAISKTKLVERIRSISKYDIYIWFIFHFKSKHMWYGKILAHARCDRCNGSTAGTKDNGGPGLLCCKWADPRWFDLVSFFSTGHGQYLWFGDGPKRQIQTMMPTNIYTHIYVSSLPTVFLHVDVNGVEQFFVKKQSGSMLKLHRSQIEWDPKPSHCMHPSSVFLRQLGWLDQRNWLCNTRAGWSWHGPGQQQLSRKPCPDPGGEHLHRGMLTLEPVPHQHPSLQGMWLVAIPLILYQLHGTMIQQFVTGWGLSCPWWFVLMKRETPWKATLKPQRIVSRWTRRLSFRFARLWERTTWCCPASTS